MEGEDVVAFGAGLGVGQYSRSTKFPAITHPVTY
jgi:hypothetical protein